MKKAGVGVGMATALMGVVTWLAGSGVATATLPLQKKAKELGYAATNCQYCHVDKLPKKDEGKHELNDAGKWLMAEKDKRGAKKVDGAWLKDYPGKK